MARQVQYEDIKFRNEILERRSYGSLELNTSIDIPMTRNSKYLDRTPSFTDECDINIRRSK